MASERCFSYGCRIAYTILLKANAGKETSFCPLSLTWWPAMLGRPAPLTSTDCSCRGINGSTWPVQDKSPAAWNKCAQRGCSKWSSEASTISWACSHPLTTFLEWAFQHVGSFNSELSAKEGTLPESANSC